VAVDEVEEAMGRLEAEHRALVELSVVRGISDEEIGGYLGIDAERVAARRSAALGTLAADLGEEPGSVEARLRGEDLGGEPSPAPAADRPLSEALPASPPESRIRLAPVLIGGLAIAAIVALVLSLSGGDDDGGSGGRSQATGRPGTLAPLVPGGAARGTARLTTGSPPRLVLSVRGLAAPDDGGGYVVWLYNDVTDARSLSGALRGSFRVSAPLPGNYRRYRFVDVSREPADGNRNHSGQSVLRAPLRSIER
jgi:hypothetical protein